MSDRKGVADRFRHIVFGRLDRLIDRLSPGEMGRNRCRVGAAGAVGMRGVDPFPFQHRRLLRVKEQVASALFRKMASFDQNGAAAECENLSGGLFRLAKGPDLHLRKELRFMDVGGHQNGERDQLRFH